MATLLTKPIVRDTGLKLGENPVFVILVPTKDGGAILLKEKSSRGKGHIVPLKGLIPHPEEAAVPEKPAGKKQVLYREDDPKSADLVDLATLESRLMVDGEECMTPDVKGRLQSIVREIREERREQFGFKPVQRGVASKPVGRSSDDAE